MRQLLQRCCDLLDDHRRQAFGGLVHHQHARVEQQRAADRQHLLLTARQLGSAVATSIGEARKQRVDALNCPRTLPCALGRQSQMLVDRKRRPHAPPLRHIADAKLGDHVGRHAQNLLPCKFHAASRRHQAGDRVAQRCLAHSIASDHAEHAGRQSQRDILQRMRSAVIDVEVAHFERRRRRGGVDRLSGHERPHGPSRPCRSRALRRRPESPAATRASARGRCASP